jgi:fused signal recognition particle receptor
VTLVVGVNGGGKTTSIAKLAYGLQNQGKRVLLAAADTFRAAAIDQLKSWGDRVGAEVIAHQPGGDPGAVVYDALQAARSRQADEVIIDTAGRLHTKFNLMEELKKVRRVAAKFDDAAPHEVILVIDATTGQNGLAQARYFTEAVGVTGIFLAKLDGTAKGGIVLAIGDELKIPIRFVGVGEKMEDMAPFDAGAFVAALCD